MQTSNLTKYLGVSIVVGVLMLAPTTFAATKKPAHTDRASIQIPIILDDPQNASSSDTSTTTPNASAPVTDPATTTPTTTGTSDTTNTTPATSTATSTSTPVSTPAPTPAPKPKSNPVTTLVHTLLPSTSSASSAKAATTSTTTAGVAAPTSAGGATAGSIYTDTRLTPQQAELLLAVALGLGVVGFMFLEAETVAALLARRPRAQQSSHA